MAANKKIMSSELLRELLNIGVFKIGDYQLKTGGKSLVYIDLRSIIGYPKIMRMLLDCIKAKQAELGLQVDDICGVPYTSLPIASAFSVLFDVPLILKRKDAKSYGTKKLVEGIIKEGNKCLVVEDVVVSGSSIIETVRCLRKEGLVVTDCISVVDREQGGQENLPREGVSYHPLFTISEVFEMYCQLNEVSENQVEQVREYLRENNYVPINESQCPPQNKISVGDMVKSNGA